jgi:hypothetical protein
MAIKMGLNNAQRILNEKGVINWKRNLLYYYLH